MLRSDSYLPHDQGLAHLKQAVLFMIAPDGEYYENNTYAVLMQHDLQTLCHAAWPELA